MAVFKDKTIHYCYCLCLCKEGEACCVSKFKGIEFVAKISGGYIIDQFILYSYIQRYGDLNKVSATLTKTNLTGLLNNLQVFKNK